MCTWAIPSACCHHPLCAEESQVLMLRLDLIQYFRSIPIYILHIFPPVTMSNSYSLLRNPHFLQDARPWQVIPVSAHHFKHTCTFLDTSFFLLDFVFSSHWCLGECCCFCIPDLCLSSPSAHLPPGLWSCYRFLSSAG
jgi:hypothetical protein